MNLLLRVLLTLVLLTVAAFSVFGFLASDEYPEATRRLPWQIGYGTTGGACLLSMVPLWRRARNDTAPVADSRRDS
jgi:hypothetical protein